MLQVTLELVSEQEADLLLDDPLRLRSALEPLLRPHFALLFEIFCHYASEHKDEDEDFWQVLA